MNIRHHPAEAGEKDLQGAVWFPKIIPWRQRYNSAVPNPELSAGFGTKCLTLFWITFCPDSSALKGVLCDLATL